MLIYSYFKREEIFLVLVGISIIGIVSPWMPSSISFLVALFNDGMGIPETLYYIIGNVSGPIFIFIWLVAFTEFYYQKYRKFVLIASVVYGIFFEIVFFVLLILDPTNIGNFYPPVDVEFTGIYLVLAISIIMIFFITGIIFSYGSINTDDPELRLKGFFLMAAFISYLLGAFLDAAVQQNYIYLIVTRGILISGAIEWLFGFITPKWLKDMILD
ncbi:MAG: conserved membrane protein of unknown function [Promethearchaeota archaeon]|nr:MAG: conserved membrane protein of unknown function [Candidatus Lokiarchaeota archaeon]